MRRQMDDQNGVAAIELVFAWITFFVVSLGIIEFGLLIHGDALLTYAASSYTRTASITDAIEARRRTNVCSEIANALSAEATEHIALFSYGLRSSSSTVALIPGSGTNWTVALRVHAERYCFLCGFFSQQPRHTIFSESPIEDDQFWCSLI